MTFAHGDVGRVIGTNDGDGDGVCCRAIGAGPVMLGSLAASDCTSIWLLFGQLPLSEGTVVAIGDIGLLNTASPLSTSVTSSLPPTSVATSVSLSPSSVTVPLSVSP
ncbi:hypothetical protein QM063_05055 [Shewanella xiamenensis]|nr:hypothetical protein [Shewanella xiamenensis]MDV5246397.1 hypothetical protein [Shewanella xiamenensis]